MKSSSLHDGRLWHLAVFSFILAALTGAALRFGLLLGFPWGWQFVNVRHAHSHLMFFGWVTPALMMLIIRWLPALTGRPFTAGDQRRQHRLLITIFCLALAAFAAFLWFGYAPVPVLGVRLPLATLFAAGNMIAWYRFAFLYRRWTHGISRQGRRMRPLRLWDAALWFMGIATLGVWGVALFSLINVRDPLWMALSTHLFLDLFAEGWFVLAVLGFIYLFQPQAAEKWAQRGENWLVMGLPVLFLLGLPAQYDLPWPVWLLAAGGGLLVAAGLAAHGRALWPHAAGGWRLVLGFLFVRAAAGPLLVIPAAAAWADRSGLRLLYLHVLLLGFVTLALWLAGGESWPDWSGVSRRWLPGTVLLLLLTLLMLTPLWPAPLKGSWVRHAAAWAALGPPLAVLGGMGRPFRLFFPDNVQKKEPLRRPRPPC